MDKNFTLTADFPTLSRAKAELLRKLLVTLAEMLNLGAYITIVPEDAPKPQINPFSIEVFGLQDYEEFSAFLDDGDVHECFVCGSQMRIRTFQKVEWPSGKRLSHRSFAVCPNCGDSWEF